MPADCFVACGATIACMSSLLTHLRLICRASYLLSTVCWGLIAVLVLYPFINLESQRAVKKAWSRQMLKACGLDFRVEASPEGLLEPQPGELVVMNHISFIDILALDALRPVHFIAKSEIRAWPVIGTLCQRTGTIFIERGKRHAVHDVLRVMAAELSQGEVVSFFPEGTTSDGRQLLPFHANLFEAAVRAGAAVRPVVISYRQDGEVTTIPAFIDDLSLVDCALVVFRAKGLSVTMRLLDRVPSDGLSRHEL
ncbi:MAG: 1-acyl-sn-glycerol-3-phosphate acyltransferase, partial [Betaproteobacteria bacterium]|nr:1-acyl-sn-glycerol-3-phosphate acyltransferase [Betaproteobacteria bacterium]NBP39307.1 1-acyl-sn-glycerol-3-phosphate acyltransferase [Betaproteobacteria bacterium]NBQ96221.1 1-acyl-sn-glycerol-3-phosphate acyltransferase [Betaproteobacteria bacterium]